MTTIEKLGGIILKMKKDKIFAADFKPEARMVEDLKLDSLDITELLVLVEDAFSIEVPLEDAKQLLTVSNAVEYIDKRVAERG